MTNTFKTLAIAALMGTVSAPAFAAAHMNTSMTCSEYKELSAEDQMTVASMAIAEINDGGEEGSIVDNVRANDDTSPDQTAAEATDGTSEAGSTVENLRATDTADDSASSDMPAETMDEAAMEQFMVVCDQNLDATVGEAAAGLRGLR